jgi:hypothetical protein
MSEDVPTPGSFPWIISGLVAALSALSGVVAYLFKLYNKRTIAHEKQRQLADADHATERRTWIEEKSAWDAEREAERERDRADYETKHREVIERYDLIAREEREAHYQREETIRQEHAEMLERLAAAENKRSAAEVELLQKMHERLSGGRRRGG